MRPDQEFREARDWLAQHKRDPFLWTIILMTLMFAALTVGVPAILLSVFPFSDAKRTIAQVLPSSDFVIVKTETLCKLPRGTYIFGYDFGVKIDPKKKKTVGRICRDVINGGWVLALKSEI